MIYFCADDYGMSDGANSRIENCLRNGILNKISVLPNGDVSGFKERLSGTDVTLSLHLNLVEGRPVSDPKEINLLVTDSGYFKYSFIGLFAISLSPKGKEFEKQVYKEIQNQIRLWKRTVGEGIPISIDSHQHTHMIPLIFKALMRVIRDEGLDVQSIRIPSEPLAPYIFTPSLFLSYTPTGIVKQWLLKILAALNKKELKDSKIPSPCFMGVMFSGNMDEAKIKKLLPRYLKHANKTNKSIEIGFHPGFIKDGEKLMDGIRKDFGKFYFSPRREAEYNTLLNLKI